MRTDQQTSARQWLWFVGMWLAGVLAMTAVSMLFRTVIAGFF